MAEKFLDLTGLTIYDKKIKDYVDENSMNIVKISISSDMENATIEKTPAFDMYSISRYILYDSNMERIFYPSSTNGNYDEFYAIDLENNKLLIGKITGFPSSSTTGEMKIITTMLSSTLIKINIDSNNNNWSMTSDNFAIFKRFFNFKDNLIILVDDTNSGDYFYRYTDAMDKTNSRFMSFNDNYEVMVQLDSENMWYGNDSGGENGTITYIPIGTKDIYCTCDITNNKLTIENRDSYDFYKRNDLLSHTRLVEMNNGWFLYPIYTGNHYGGFLEDFDGFYYETTNYSNYVFDLELVKKNLLVKDSITSTPTKVAEYFTDGVDTYTTHYTITMKEFSYENEKKIPLTDVFSDEDIAILKAHPESCHIYNGDIETLHPNGENAHNIYFYKSLGNEEMHAIFSASYFASENKILFNSNYFNEIMPSATKNSNGLMSSADKSKLDSVDLYSQLHYMYITNEEYDTNSNGELTYYSGTISKSYYKLFESDLHPATFRLVAYDYEITMYPNDDVNNEFYGFYNYQNEIVISIFRLYRPTSTSDGTVVLVKSINLKGKNFKLKEISITTDEWQNDTTYTDYPYMVAIHNENITKEHTPNVILSLTDSLSGNIAPVAETDDGILMLWSKSAINITIPNIEFTLSETR